MIGVYTRHTCSMFWFENFQVQDDGGTWHRWVMPTCEDCGAVRPAIELESA